MRVLISDVISELIRDKIDSSKLRGSKSTFKSIKVSTIAAFKPEIGMLLHHPS